MDNGLPGASGQRRMLLPYAFPAARLEARLAEVAGQWRAAVERYGAPETDQATTERFRRWTAGFMALLLPPTLDSRAGRQIGVTLGLFVAFDADALQATTATLSAATLDGLPPDDVVALAPRLGAVLAALSAGFLVAAKETLTSEREDAREALLAHRRQAADALRASDARFRAIFENAGVGISITDMDGRFIETNHTMQVAMAYSDAELRGRRFSELLHPDDAENAWRLYQQLAAGGAQHSEFDGRFVRKDGLIAWGHVTTSFVRDDIGRPLYAIEISENVTQRKLAEAALAEQHRATAIARSEARAILDSTNEAMVLVAPDGRVSWANDRAAIFFAIESDQARGRQIADFCEHLARVFGGEEQIAPVAALASDLERAFTADLAQDWPERRDLELHSQPVRDQEGVALGRLYSFRDVTSERAVDRLKSDFVSTVSHEIRTPLTSIRGYVDLLLLDEAGDLNAEQREFLTIVGSNSERLLNLINDLLDISKLESGSIELRRGAVSLAPVIAAVVASFRPQIAGKAQHLTVDVPADFPPVFGDQQRIMQILSNLISNAHKYTPAGGRIGVRVEQQDGFARVSVHDTGVGISPADQAQLFTRFYRAVNRSTQDISGTGLGLAITRSLVVMHGGEITVASAPGLGSTFTFTLPLAGA